MSSKISGVQRHLSRTANALLATCLVTMSALGTAQAPKPASDHGSANVPANRSRYSPNHFPRRAAMYYQNVWGIDSIKVRSAESGELIRFNYRVLDAAKASQLNDKKLAPTLIAPRAGVSLVVPSLEKVGQLRQSGAPEDGKVYWMAFSNPRRSVKPGDRVNVVIGNFHADGLIVE